MTASVLLQTDYAKGLAPWGVQAPAGKVTTGQESDGRWYVRQVCTPGVNWNGMQRCDLMQTTPTPLREGDEIALRWAQKLEDGFYAPNPGWCVVGAEVHDQRGSTQSPLELNTAGGANGVQARCFGGQLGAIPPGVPVNAADKFYSQWFPFTVGTYHDCELGLILSGDRTKGRIRYAVDGVTLVDHVCATLYAGSTGYLKQAFYRDPSQASNREAAVRFGNMTVWMGAGAWEAATGTTPTPPPPPPVRPIHDAVAQVDPKANPNIRHALDLIADKVEQ